jgi:hypothetical protein
VAVMQTALSLAISSTTTRRAAASAVIILVLVGSGIITGLLVFEADMSVYLYLFNFLNLPFVSVQRIFGEASPFNTEGSHRLNDIPAALMIAANFAWAFVFATVVWWRYKRMAVTR